MSLLDKIRPTSASIRKEYVEKRQRALYASNPAKTALVREKVEKMMASRARHRRARLTPRG